VCFDMLGEKTNKQTNKQGCWFVQRSAQQVRAAQLGAERGKGASVSVVVAAQTAQETGVGAQAGALFSSGGGRDAAGKRSGGGRVSVVFSELCWRDERCNLLQQTHLQRLRAAGAGATRQSSERLSVLLAKLVCHSVQDFD
jgi:hypothetical protein